MSDFAFVPDGTVFMEQDHDESRAKFKVFNSAPQFFS
jgi:hypothetical protein